MLAQCFQSATDLARAIRTGRVRARELLEMYIDRVERHDGALNAIVVRDLEGARKRAEEADAALSRGVSWGALHGVPMTVKESFNLAGFATTWGAPEFKHNRASEDAVAVQRLKREGAVVFGKTNVPLGLNDFQTYNDVYGATNNPWDLTRGPGGSSGGSAAALAAGLTGLELGSDIGGSIRNPAHYCGVFGHKPTFGLLPARGHTLGGLRPADIGVVGPLSRSAQDLELVVRSLAGPDELERAGVRVELEPLGKPIASLRIAVWTGDPLAPVDRDVEAAVARVARALGEAGADIDERARPEIDDGRSAELYRSLLNAALSIASPEPTFARLEAKAASLDPSDQRQEARSLRATTMRHRTFIQLDEARTRLRWSWHRFFQSYDFVLMPVMPTAAFPHDRRPFSQRRLLVDGAERAYLEGLYWAGIASVAYLPSTVLPAGRSRDGLPVGVQVVGPAYGDLKTIQLASQLEARGFAFTPPTGFA